MDAVGPEIFTFDKLVRTIGATLGRRARIVHVWPGVSLCVSRLVGLAVGDVLLTRDEVRGLTSDLLVSSRAPTATTHLSEWVKRNAERLGRRYASELARHFA